MAATPTATLKDRTMRIIEKNYRGVDGFLIVGTDPEGRKVSIFAETRDAAEHIRDKKKRGEGIVAADWEVRIPSSSLASW